MPPSPRSPRSGRLPEDQRLSVIAEDGDAHVSGSGSPPAVPPRSTHRPFARRWRDAPPRASLELKPPEYSTLDEMTQMRGRLAQLRAKPAVARRGGWKRLLVIIALVVVAIGIALGVGLGVGLTRRQSNASSSDNTPSPSPGGINETFPAGQYTVRTNLASVNTSCTANAATFLCYPYTTYSSSSSLSVASFNWIINATGNNYTISSSENPFSILFSNIPLNLTDADTANERYTFSLSMDKVVTPSSPITNDNANAECFFNGTLLSVALYTKLNAMNVSTNPTTNDGQASWNTWGFAAEINQTISGGTNVPACYEVVNGNMGSQVTSGLAPQPSNSQCGCFYRNFNL